MPSLYDFKKHADLQSCLPICLLGFDAIYVNRQSADSWIQEVNGTVQRWGQLADT